jgi:hypothetical protein
MKKTKKTALSPAPATPSAITAKPAFKAAAADPKPIAAAPLARAAQQAKPLAPPPIRVPAPAAPAPAVVAPPPAPKPAAAPSATLITAKIDVGFGNALYLRGEGPGLSWNAGLLLDNVGSDQWSISISGAKQPVVFKFLLNDSTWSAGEDYKAEPGTKVTVTPEF